jgi:hypothetical protein
MKLDFEQRHEAERLIESDEDTMRALIYELIVLRASVARMIDWLAKEDIENDPDDLYSGRCHRVAAAKEIFWMAPSPTATPSE